MLLGFRFSISTLEYRKSNESEGYSFPLMKIVTTTDVSFVYATLGLEIERIKIPKPPLCVSTSSPEIAPNLMLI
jgi:hypothetical protein